MDLFRVLGAAAFGAVLGASIAWIVDRHKAQVATSFTMHRECRRRRKTDPLSTVEN